MVEHTRQNKEPQPSAPNGLQQMVYRLQKKYEDLAYEDRRLRIADEIIQMDVSEQTRAKLIDQLG
jgi:hypothetical protein